MGEESAVIHLVSSTIGKVCLVLLTPLAYVIGTIMDGLPRTHRDIMGVYRRLSEHRRVVIIYKDESEGSDWNILKELVE